MATQTVNVPLEPKKRNILLIAMIAQHFGFLLTCYCPGIAVPTILAEFGRMEYYALPGVAFAFGECLVIPIAAGLGDTIGRRWINIVALLLMCVGSVAVYFAPSFLAFIVLWMLCGIFVGGYLTNAFVIMSDVTDLKDRPRFAGYLASTTAAGMLLGPLLAGMVVDSGWIRGVYLLPIPLYLFSALATFAIYPTKRSGRVVRFDKLGTLLLVLSVTPFVVLLNFGGKMFPWLSPISALCVVLIVGCSIALVRWDLKVEQPAVNFKMLKNRNVALASSFSFLFNSFSVLAAGFVVLMGQAVLGTSATVSGTLMMPLTIVSLIIPLFLGPWVGKDKNRYKRCFILCGLISTVTLIGISRLHAGSPIVILYALMTFGGIAYSLSGTCTPPFLQLNLDRSLYGAGQGTMQFFTVLGVTLTSSLFGLLLGLAPDQATGLSWCFLCGGLICLVESVIAAIYIKRIPPEPQASQTPAG